MTSITKFKIGKSVIYLQTATLLFGIALLSFGLYDSLLEHINDFNKSNFVIIFSSFLTVYILMTYFTHNHIHKVELKGLILAEFFHSVIDGAVVGFAYFVNPILGFGTLISVLGHELPKILGTYIIIKSEIKSFWLSVKYLTYAQAGLPFFAIIFYFLGTKIDEKYHEYLEAIALASLFAIVLRLIIKTFLIHKHKH